MEKRCVITGLGLICAAGNDVDTCWQNICAGKTGIDEVKSVSTEGCVAFACMRPTRPCATAG